MATFGGDSADDERDDSLDSFQECETKQGHTVMSKVPNAAPATQAAGVKKAIRVFRI